MKNSFKIKDVLIPNRLVLAPMAGISNTSFRKIVKLMGAGLIYAEMVSSNALVYNNEKTLALLKMSDIERPIAEQIFGSDIDTFVNAAKIVEKQMHPDIIDINMGCPVPKVALRAQAGSALLKDPEKIGQIVEAVVKAVSVPVTVKIRSGWDEEHINACEVAKICEQAGASAIAIHARTRQQGYSGLADWNIIKQVKESVSIPVIGNGDIIDGKSAKAMFEYTGCDAIMIGRASNGNPWIFKEISTFLESGVSPSAPNILEKRDMILRHLDMLIDFKGEYTAVREMRKQIAWYVKGLAGATEFRNTVNKIEDVKELKRAIREWLKE